LFHFIKNNLVRLNAGSWDRLVGNYLVLTPKDQVLVSINLSNISIKNRKDLLTTLDKSPKAKLIKNLF
jgi:hypothetical protein